MPGARHRRRSRTPALHLRQLRMHRHHRHHRHHRRPRRHHHRRFVRRRTRRRGRFAAAPSPASATHVSTARTVAPKAARRTNTAAPTTTAAVTSRASVVAPLRLARPQVAVAARSHGQKLTRRNCEAHRAPRLPRLRVAFPDCCAITAPMEPLTFRTTMTHGAGAHAHCARKLTVADARAGRSRR